MTEEVGKTAGAGEGSKGTAGVPLPKKTYPPDIILDKDGKPCRSCNSKTAFSAWASQAKAAKTPRTEASTSASAAPIAFGAAAAATSASSAATQTSDSECPADAETLGRGTWTLLHSMAAQYPTSPSLSQQSDIKGFMNLFARLYPCWVCAEDFQSYLKRDPIRASSRNEFGTWLCNAHNDVNKKLGKPTFDCSKWEERWRTGWKDGRCD